MIADFNEAVDDINSLFFQYWNANTAAITTYIPTIEWKDVELEQSKTDYFCRISVENVFEEQATLSNCVTASGSKRYSCSGLVIVEIEGLACNANAAEIVRKLANVAKKAFRGKTTDNGIWFRNVRIISKDRDELHVKTNLIAEYEYDEVS